MAGAPKGEQLYEVVVGGRINEISEVESVYLESFRLGYAGYSYRELRQIHGEYNSQIDANALYDAKAFRNSLKGNSSNKNNDSLPTNESDDRKALWQGLSSLPEGNTYLPTQTHTRQANVEGDEDDDRAWRQTSTGRWELEKRWGTVTLPISGMGGG